MKIVCPVCKQGAVLSVEVFAKDDGFKDPENDCRLTCEHCSLEKEITFPFVIRTGLLILFLLPIACSWALFLLYASALGEGWVRLSVFLVHIAIGVYAGTRLITSCAARVILKDWKAFAKGRGDDASSNHSSPDH